MKGNKKVLEKLNLNLKDELTAIDQYMLHAEECEDWGYEKLHSYIKRRAITEMKHAEALIGRILFLEGTPVVNQLFPLHIADNVEGIMENDRLAEMRAIKSYNESIIVAREALDQTTGELFDAHLKQEEEHLDWIEEQQDQIEQIGIQNYLAEQMG